MQSANLQASEAPAACSRPRTSATSNGLGGHRGWDRVAMHKVVGDDRWFVVNICRSSRFIFGQIKLKIHQKMKLYLLQFELWKHNWFISCHQAFSARFPSSFVRWNQNVSRWRSGTASSGWNCNVENVPLYKCYLRNKCIKFSKYFAGKKAFHIFEIVSFYCVLEIEILNLAIWKLASLHCRHRF